MPRDPTPLTVPTVPTAPDAASPADPSLRLRLAQAHAETRLFGAADAVRVGRYRMIERLGAGGMGVVWSAWDPELGRLVAIKVPAGPSGQRMRDEARALARLSHPHVVPIYDVLEEQERVLLVMELVEGKTLRDACESRSALQIVRLFRQAAEGLAAAHAAGLIHRDFKPDNAIVGVDNRVRVLDFGLADVAGDGDGAVAGTPKYMAPEQAAGGALTPAVDQYAFCLALREMLGGELPRWLQPIIARGTAADPAQRFPSMSALHAALGNDPGSRWRRRGLTLGLVASVGATIAVVVTRDDHQVEPCSGAREQLRHAWGSDRRTEVMDALSALTGAYARDATHAVIARLDDYARSWMTLEHDSCRAHLSHELSTPAFDRRTACLARPRAALEMWGELAKRTDDAGLPGLIEAQRALPSIDACANDAELLAGASPPPAAIALDADLARAEVLRDSGRIDEASPALDAIVARARAIDFAPLLARAEIARGRVDLIAQNDDMGAAAFDRALTLAIEAGADALAVEAWARRAWSLAMTSQAGARAAVDGRALIEALDRRTKDAGRFARALLHNNLGGVAQASGDSTEARREFSTARRLASDLPPSLSAELDGAAENELMLGATSVAEVGATLIAARTRTLGATHPLTLQARALVASATTDTVIARRELRDAVLAMARYHPALGGPMADLAREPLWLSVVAGELADATALAGVVESAAAHGADAGYVAFARAYGSLAHGDAASALTVFRAEEAGLELSPSSPWWLRSRMLNLRIGAALAELGLGHRGPARQEVDAADVLLAAIAGKLPPAMAQRRRDALALLRTRLEP